MVLVVRARVLGERRGDRVHERLVAPSHRGVQPAEEQRARAVSFGEARDARVGGHLSREVEQRVAPVGHRAGFESVHQVLDRLELLITFRLWFLSNGGGRWGGSDGPVRMEGRRVGRFILDVAANKSFVRIGRMGRSVPRGCAKPRTMTLAAT